MKKQLFMLLFLLSNYYVMLGQFVNGDFQTPLPNAIGDCNAGDVWTYSMPSTAGPGEPQYTSYNSPGNYWIDLTPCWAFGNEVWIEQVVNIPTIKCYAVKLDLMTVCGWDLSDAGVFISVDGMQIGSRVYSDSFDCVGGTAWKTRQSEPFFVTSPGYHTIRFTGMGLLQNGQIGNPGVMGVDNISLVPSSPCSGAGIAIEAESQHHFSAQLSSNPLLSAGYLSLQTAAPTSLNVQLFDISGKCVYQKEVNLGTTEEKMAFPAELKSGFYLLQITDKHSIWQTKMLYDY